MIHLQRGIAKLRAVSWAPIPTWVTATPTYNTAGYAMSQRNDEGCTGARRGNHNGDSEHQPPYTVVVGEARVMIHNKMRITQQWGGFDEEYENRK